MKPHFLVLTICFLNFANFVKAHDENSELTTNESLILELISVISLFSFVAICFYLSYTPDYWHYYHRQQTIPMNQLPIASPV